MIRRRITISTFIFLLVLAVLLFFPGYSDTVRRFIQLPPVSEVELKSVETTEQWAQEVLRTGHNLVYYIWVVGAIAVGILAAVSYYFFTWWGEHKDIIRSLSSWQQTVKKSESFVLKAAEMLPGQVFIDYSDPTVYENFTRSVEGMLPIISPEEIDIQIANSALITPIPSEVYVRLGNYFRFRAHTSLKAGRDAQFNRDLWYAIRRYERARDTAKLESARRSTIIFGHACHGIAISLIHLKRNAEAEKFAKEAVDHLQGEIGSGVLPLITYGVALKRSGKLKRAVEVFEDAERVQVHPLINYNLACTYAKLGDEAQDDGSREGNYRKALAALERIMGRLGSQLYVIEAVDIDEDFNNMRKDALVGPKLEKTIRALKAEG